MSGSNPKAAAAGSAAGSGGLVTGKEEKKKTGGGVLNRLKARRQAPHHAAEDGIGAAVTEQELLALDTIRPEHVLRLSRVTESECRPDRALPSHRAPGPLSFSAEPAARHLTGPGDHPGPLSRPGRVARLLDGPARCSPLLPRPGWKGVRLELDRALLCPATPGSSGAGPSWASRPGRSPPKLDPFG